MQAKETGRVLVSMPAAVANLLRTRAKENYRSVGNEAMMLIELGLAAEKAASNPTA